MTNIDWKIKTFSELTTTELYEIIKARVNVFVVGQRHQISRNFHRQSCNHGKRKRNGTWKTIDFLRD